MKKQIVFFDLIILTVILTLVNCSGTGDTQKQAEKAFMSPEENVFTSPGEGVAFRINERLGRGLNRDFRARGDDWKEREEKYFQMVKDAGFHSVRLVVSWHRYCLEEPPYTIDKVWFEKIDEVVEMALSRGLLITLDFHYYPLISFTGKNIYMLEEPFEPYDINIARFKSLWGQIAEHYQDYPMELLFELMNEPCCYLGPVRYNELVKELIDIIRPKNPDRIIIVGPEVWYRVYALDNLMLPKDDRNIIVAFHNYVPFNFTHQGVGFLKGAKEWEKVTWTKTLAEWEELLEILYRAAAWGAERNRPLTLSEFGVIGQGARDIQSRDLYVYTQTREAERLGISWNYWGRTMDRETGEWDESLLDAMIPPEDYLTKRKQIK